MTARAIVSAYNRESLIAHLQKRPLPFMVEIADGRRRSDDQSRLFRLWVNEAAKELKEDVEELRAFCKLRFGAPILCAESEIFLDRYERAIRPLTYEEKIEAMMEPLDFPITRLMNTGQMSRFLDAVARHFNNLGVTLTEPVSEDA